MGVNIARLTTPTLGKAWHDWVQERCGVDSEVLVEIERRLNALNDQISADSGLGPQYRMGHSYVTPPFGVPIADAREWFRQVVETEIGPLLDEYWFRCTREISEGQGAPS